ncbi:MAG: hypothetical protein ACLRXQ_03310 [Phascolarctobacterium faecium]
MMCVSILTATNSFTIKDVGIPVSMEQDVDGGDVLVTLRIRNTKNQEPRLF